MVKVFFFWSQGITGIVFMVLVNVRVVVRVVRDR